MPVVQNTKIVCAKAPCSLVICRPHMRWTDFQHRVHQRPFPPAFAKAYKLQVIVVSTTPMSGSGVVETQLLLRAGSLGLTTNPTFGVIKF